MEQIVSLYLTSGDTRKISTPANSAHVVMYAGAASCLLLIGGAARRWVASGVGGSNIVKMGPCGAVSVCGPELVFGRTRFHVASLTPHTSSSTPSYTKPRERSDDSCGKCHTTLDLCCSHDFLSEFGGNR